MSLITLPRYEELTPESLYEFRKQLEASIYQVDKEKELGIEYVSSQTFGKKEELAKYGSFLKRNKALELGLNNRYPKICLARGNCEGYRVEFSVYSAATKPNEHLEINLSVLAIKCWSRETQFALYEHIENTLYW